MPVSPLKVKVPTGERSKAPVLETVIGPPLTARFQLPDETADPVEFTTAPVPLIEQVDPLQVPNETCADVGVVVSKVTPGDQPARTI